MLINDGVNMPAPLGARASRPPKSGRRRTDFDPDPDSMASPRLFVGRPARPPRVESAPA